MPAALDWLWLLLGGSLTLAIAVALLAWIADDLRRPAGEFQRRAAADGAPPSAADQAARSAATSRTSEPQETR